ncbi:MAG: pyruvate dehydrogenase (acetyl-transferring) E1 component subunit alpha [Desulfobacterales bacterium]|nr:pyruvate dehydrogenase (acetyl-transferring) E1 component subunit alpha [Desulfobacterales bacterium]
MPLDHIQTFHVSRLDILDENGEVDEELEPKLEPDQLIFLHRAMTLSRMADARMLNLQRQGRIGTIPLCHGQEAAFCAPVMAIKETDWLVPSYRELGARLMRGENLVQLLHIFNGFEEGVLGGSNDRNLPISIILASQLPHAVGLAYGARMRGESDTLALTLFGDGATSEGDFHEALNFAAVMNVPVIFLCQNNQFAISTPRKWQTRSATIAQKAIAYGVQGIQVDGNDPLAVYQATLKAAERARAGKGPTLIEAVTYRMQMHTTADDPSRYREDEEVASWEKKDPLVRFQLYLENKGIWDKEKQAAMEAEIKAEVDASVKTYEEETRFEPDAPFDYVFQDPVPLIQAQREEFLNTLKEEKENG